MQSSTGCGAVESSAWWMLNGISLVGALLLEYMETKSKSSISAIFV